MPITFNCPHCRTTFRVDDRLAGRPNKCVTCGKISPIPDPRSLTPTAPPPPAPAPMPAPAPPPGEEFHLPVDARDDRFQQPQAAAGLPVPTALPDGPVEVPVTPVDRSPAAWRQPAPYVLLSLAIGMTALPIALLLLASPLAAAVFAGVGLVVGLAGCCFTLARHRGGFLGSLAGPATCVSALVVALGLIVNQQRAGALGFLGLDKPTLRAILSVQPGHIVVFPTPGTFREHVGKILEEMFPPGTVTEIRQDATQRELLLAAQLKKSIEGISQADKVAQLIAHLKAKDVHFKGFTTGDPKTVLAGVLQRGGVFSITLVPAGKNGDSLTPAKQKHGSLLHADGIKQVVEHAQLGSDARPLLTALREAAQDYASLTDALNIVGDRRAFLINVGRDEDAHEKAVKKLVTWADDPLFVPRPPPRLFDAVNPAGEGGIGGGKYTLRSPRKSWWRQLSKSDREQVTLNATNVLPSMRWKEFAKDTLIRWESFSLLTKEARTLTVDSFDIAIEVPNDKKVVVFRNQRLLRDPSEKNVKTQATAIVTRRLGLKVLEEDFSILPAENQSIGTLAYSQLADRIPPSHVAPDVEVYPLAQFHNRVTQENAALPK